MGTSIVSRIMTHRGSRLLLFNAAAGLVCLALCGPSCQAKSAVGDRPAANLLPSDHNTFVAVREVFERIRRAVGTRGIAPVLQIRAPGSPRPPQIAWYDPVKGVIVIDAEVVDLCEQTAGMDATGRTRVADALAVVVGHELAHFYRNHAWGNDYGNRAGGAQAGVAVATVEAEADFYGGFYGYLAGYDTLAVAPTVLELLYQRYQLDDAKLQGYPPLTDRKRIAVEAADRVNKLIPAFEAGTQFLIAEQWDSARRCFDYVASEFPSREVLNNAGVARAMEATQVDEKEVDTLPWAKYRYPFLADTKSRLRFTGFRGPEQRRQELLGEALALFVGASEADPTFAPALVNVACVYQIMGKTNHALLYAKEAFDVAEKSNEPIVMASARVARGIVYAGQGQIKLAVEDFNAAKEVNEVLARHNLAAVNSGTPAPTPENKALGRETIGGVTPDDASAFPRDADFDEVYVAHPEGNRAGILIKQRFLPNQYKAIRVSTNTNLARFVSTLPGYGGVNAGGIGIGSPLSEVSKKYGAQPDQVMSFRDATMHVYRYQDAGIVFEIDAGAKVAGWTIYSTAR